MHDGKYTKEEAGYSKGKPEAHCGICAHFHNGACSLVSGRINSQMWCRFFLKAKT